MSAATEPQTFAALIGASGKTLRWPSIFAFFAGLLMSDLATFLIQGLMQGGLNHFASALPPFSLWAQLIIAAVLLTACSVVAFRYLKNALAASAAAAFAFMLLMLPFRFLLFGSQPHPVLIGSSFAWNFLFLAGLVFSVRYIQPLWLGLAVGAAAGPLLIQVPRSLALARIYNYQLSVGGELTSAAFNLISAAVFAAVVWGLNDLAAVAAQEAAARPSAGVPATGPIKPAPTPPPPEASGPPAESSIEIDRARLPLFHTLNEFVAAVAARRAAVLRLRLADYAEVYQEFVGFAGPSAQSRLLCAACKAEFPSSLTLRLAAPDVFRADAAGDRPAPAPGCPRCGAAEALLAYRPAPH